MKRKQADHANGVNGRIPPLEPGDRLTRAEFERRYEAMPHLKKAELIEGTVFMPSPIRVRRHGEPDMMLSTWLGLYQAATPGVSGAVNSTTRLGPNNEVQPDQSLYITREYGGQARIGKKDYFETAPDLVAEVAASSASYDIHFKLPVYQKHGVRECIIWRVLDGAVDWYVLSENDKEKHEADNKGWLHSQIFPGLWLDVPALLRGDLARVVKVLQRGTRSAEHSAFVARLEEKRKEAKAKKRRR